MMHPPGRKSVMAMWAGAMALSLAAVLAPRPAPAQAQIPTPAPTPTQGPVSDDTRPLSPAQTLLFETPHLQNVTQPGTLTYAWVREGSPPVSDTVAVQVRKVNADGTKDLAFSYLTGPRRVEFPQLDHFRGNPLLMLTLERDVLEMKDQLGVSVAYFRNKMRDAFVTQASVAPGTFLLGGTAVPAQVVTLRPFEHDSRLERMSQVQAKTYTFVLSDAVPGGIAEIRIAMPPDAAMGAPAFEQRTTFQGVQP